MIADYEVRDDLPEARLDRILSRLTTAEDRLTTRLDAFTEQQTTLSDNLLSYQDFELELRLHFEEIATADGTIADDGTTAGLVASTVASRRKRLIDLPSRATIPLQR